MHGMLETPSDWEKLSDGGIVSGSLERRMWDDVFGMFTDRFVKSSGAGRSAGSEESPRAGQSNGLRGTAVLCHLVLTTGLPTGVVRLTIKLDDIAPPPDNVPARADGYGRPAVGRQTTAQS